MTNFERYKTFRDALENYSRQKGEYVFNLYDGVSAGRFVNWLYEECT